jgi:GNAT superfamily N-acetyltransferase
VVRRAAPDEREGVAAMVAAAFAQDPAWAFIFGEEYERLAAYFAGALFDVRVAARNVWVTDDLAAVAMWDSPDRSDVVPGYAESVWAEYRLVAGEGAWQRLQIYNEAVAAASPAEPHWYLGVLATHPRRQREGLASAVLAPVVDEADRVGLACCLETSTAENRRFYERRGFTQATDVLLSGGPTTWWLRRGPRHGPGDGCESPRGAEQDVA